MNALAEEKASASSFDVPRFLGEVKAELKKVSWPVRSELVTYTGVTGIAVAVVCALIWVCDTFFSRLFNLIMN